MRIYDTRIRQSVELELSHLVRLYTCGITPYDSAHVGHAATYLTYDILQRRLRDLGHETRCVRNVTDIDDDMFAKARSTGQDWKLLADRETALFDTMMNALGLLRSFSDPRASSAISDILGFIGMILDRGHGYESGGQVYFSVDSWPDFGHVGRYSKAQMLELSAERGGDPHDSNKTNPLDFILWQKSRDDEPSWDSLWGPGRPGWHIECSALAMRELGMPVDIHGGGADLIYPHHECEDAQSRAATGQPFVRHWMHVAMVRMNGEKMSKSLGNLVFVHDLIQQWDAAVIRTAITSNHYRHDWEWHSRTMESAADRVSLWRDGRRGDGSAALDDVRDALDEDLDTPSALLAVDKAATAGFKTTDALALLGIHL